MYIDNVKKLKKDLKELVWVDGDIEAASDDSQDLNLDNLISIMEKWLYGAVSCKFDTDEESIDEFFTNDPWPYADDIEGLKKRLKSDYKKLQKIYKIVKTELNLK